MIKLIKRNYLLLVFISFFLLASFIYFWPFLRYPAFNLIDDGTTLKVSREIISGNFKNLVEIQNGRIRSFYWLYFVFIYSLTGMHPLGFWIGQAIVFGLTLFSIWYLLVDKIDRKKWKSYLVTLTLLLLFFIPAISENLFRLGTAEVRQMLLIIWFMIWMKKSLKEKIPNWIGFLIFLLAIFTKETSVLLLPILFIFLLPHIVINYKKHANKFCSLLFFSFFSLAFYSLLTAMRATSSYSSNFNISLSQIKTNLLISRLSANEIYYLLFMLLTLGFIRLVIFLIRSKVFFKKKENYIFEVLIQFWKENSLAFATLMGLLSSLFFVFSWQHQLERYYYPVYIFLFIYSVVEIDKSVKIFSSVKKSRHKVAMVFSPMLVLYILHMTFFQKITPNLRSYISRNHNIKRLWYSDYQNSYFIINLLLRENISKMYTIIDDYEVVYELGFFTNKLDFEKNKIEIFSPNKEITKYHKYIFYLNNIEEAFLNDKNRDVILVTIESKDLDLNLDNYSRQLLSNEFLDKHSVRTNWVIWRKKQ